MKWHLTSDVSQIEILKNSIENYFSEYNFLICKKSLKKFLKIKNYMNIYLPIIIIKDFDHLYNFYIHFYNFTKK